MRSPPAAPAALPPMSPSFPVTPEAPPVSPEIPLVNPLVRPPRSPVGCSGWAGWAPGRTPAAPSLPGAAMAGFFGSSKKSSSSPGIRSRLISTGFGGSGGFTSGSGFGFEENKFEIVWKLKKKHPVFNLPPQTRSIQNGKKTFLTLSLFKKTTKWLI